VRLGEWNLATVKDCRETIHYRNCVTDSVQDIPIEQTILHPDYNIYDANSKNDIALIRLSRDCDYNNFVKPICLPTTKNLRQTDLDGAFIVSGWGRSENAPKSNIKLWAEVGITKLETCRSMLPSKNLWAKQVCAGGGNGANSCKGDSGGPLMKIGIESEQYFFYAAGVESFGPDLCGSQNRPGVYTKVSEYIDWILETIKP
jgi:secreted trypsin-like serine protease